MIRIFTLLLLALLQVTLNGCSSTPKQQHLSTIDRSAALSHQQQLQGITSWRLQGQIALFDVIAQKRHSLYLDWQHSPATSTIRFSHPLQGTLARLEQTPAGAVLIDDDDNRYYAADAETLLRDYFDLALPFNLVSELMLGREQPTMQQQQYIVLDQQQPPLALLSSYAIPASGQLWQAQLSNYKAVQGIQLPQQFELSAREWRIKLRVNQWQL
ncbi:lipoprotein insertase outer membrane protein LolB [Pseudidiomarina mangrovi]|uniref:lipoprotein insertase outer membrane protein LolB n=1 Tax=Pseudidiomarina mangrovi TaxID=2487133 RepID=UPI000FCAD14A|nr:lipoprotein insertase outer membrane protein LolB [Pseudidiomarina mangrovi]